MWSYDGLANPPAVVAKADPTPVAELFIRPDRHGLHLWTSPDYDKLNRFVAWFDRLTEDEARTWLNSLGRP